MPDPSSRDLLPESTPDAPSPLAGHVARRFALLVGIDRYVDPGIAPLNFCVSDVISLSEKLEALGYTVVCLHDRATEERLSPTRDNVEAELSRVCEAADVDDLIWVHIACHGILSEGRPLLITRETRLATVKDRALPLQTVERALRASKARRLILTLDACHCGVSEGRGLTDDAFNRNVHERATGFALLAGSTAEQVAQEWQDKKHGVFTYYLLEALEGRADRAQKGFVTVDDVKTYVLDALTRWSLSKGGLLQQPTARTEGMGDIILADVARPASATSIGKQGAPPMTRRLLLGAGIAAGVVAAGGYAIKRWVLGESSKPAEQPDAGPSVAASVAARPTAPLPDPVELPIAPRPAGAPTGREFIERVKELSPKAYSEAAVREILSGNVPPFERLMKPVALTYARAAPSAAPSSRLPRYTPAPPETSKVVVWVLPDYLAIGSDDDFVRVPLSARDAERVADALKCFLPTPQIVDETYEQAEVKLGAQPMVPFDATKMAKPATFLAHNTLIEQRRKSKGEKLGSLVAGHKKDLVLTGRMKGQPGRSAIYGWQMEETGKPVQPLSLVHDLEHFDYTFGVRLILRDVYVDGVRRSVDEALADENLAAALLGPPSVPDDPPEE